MPGNRVFTLRTVLRILLPLLASVQGCDQGNYSPGAGRDDVSFFILVGEPTGDSLRPLLGLEWSPEIDPSDNRNVLESLDELGIRTLVYSPVTPADSFPGNDPCYAGLIGSGMQVILEFSISREGTPEGGYPLLSQAVRQSSDTTLWGDEATGVSFLITSPDEHPRDSDALSLSAGRLAETVQALRSEFPSMSIGAGGWTLEGEWTGEEAEEFIEALGDSGSRPDFISFRLPPGPPADIAPLVSELRRLLERQCLGETELVVSGWTPEAVDAPGQPPSQALLAAWWINLQNSGVSDAVLVTGAGWDALHDVAPSPLLRTLSLFAECTKYPSRVATGITMNGDQWSEPDSVNRLWVLAGEDTSGKVAVLLANMTPQKATVEMTYLVPSLAAGFSSSVMKVDLTDGRVIWTGLDGPSMEMVPQEALLVVAAPI